MYIMYVYLYRWQFTKLCTCEYIHINIHTYIHGIRVCMSYVDLYVYLVAGLSGGDFPRQHALAAMLRSHIGCRI